MLSRVVTNVRVFPAYARDGAQHQARHGHGTSGHKESRRVVARHIVQQTCADRL